MAKQTHKTLDLPSFEEAPKVAIVVAPFYREISEDLVKGAVGVLDEVGASHDVIEVPGALEVPTAIGIAARMGDFDAFVALGCVIRGETTHYETVCNDSSRGITLLGLQGLCIGNGILTVENTDQAVVRADPKDQNKGGGAAAAALHLLALSQRMKDAKNKGVGFLAGGDLS